MNFILFFSLLLFSSTLFGAHTAVFSVGGMPAFSKDVMTGPKKEAMPQATAMVAAKLMKAVLGGRRTQTRKILQNSPNLINVQDAHGFPLLHIAIGNKKSKKVIELLLSFGAHMTGGVNSAAFNGARPLHVATEVGNRWLVDRLIELGADVHATDALNRTPLFSACLWKNFDLARYLIEKYSANYNHHDAYGNSITMYLIRCIERYPDQQSERAIHEFLCELLAKPDFNPAGSNTVGLTVLMYAAQSSPLLFNTLLDSPRMSELEKNPEPLRKTLFNLILQGKLEHVRVLCERVFTNVEMTNENGVTPLFFAVESGQFEIVKYLIQECHANVMHLDKDGRTILFYGHDSKPYITTHNDDNSGKSVQDYNAQLHTDLLNYLLSLPKLDVNHVSNKGSVAFAHVVGAANEYVFQTFLRCDRVKVNVPGERLSAVQAAVVCGNIHRVRSLVRAGADINFRSPGTGSTAFVYAAAHGHCEIMRLLLDSGALVSQSDVAEPNILHHIAHSGDHKILRRILPEIESSELNRRDKKGFVPLHYAYQKRNLEIFTALVQAGAYVDIPLKSDGGPLFDRLMTKEYQLIASQGLRSDSIFAAIKNDDVDRVVELLSTEPRVIHSTFNSMTPLHFLVVHGTGHMLNVYFAHSDELDVDARDKQGWTALHLATHHGRMDMAQLLVEMGAAVSALDSSGLTSLDHALCLNRVAIIKLLLEHDAPSKYLEQLLGTQRSPHIKFMLSKGVRLIDIAAMHGNVDFIETLSCHDLFGAGPEGMTLLHWAMIREMSCDKLVDLLDIMDQRAGNQQQRADLLNARNSRGETALYLAAQLGLHEQVRLLIDAGADMNSEDGSGLLPFDCCYLQQQNQRTVGIERSVFLQTRENLNRVQRLLLDSGARSNIAARAAEKVRRSHQRPCERERG